MNISRSKTKSTGRNFAALRRMLEADSREPAEFLNERPLANKKYIVKNLRQGGSPVPKGYDSWIEYWEKSTGLKSKFCHSTECPGVLLRRASDGAHVQLADSKDKSWYIVPLCHACNCQFGDEIEVSGPLVSVTKPSRILW